jgi:hypothetical protein
MAMERILLYLIFGFFLFLIINWIMNGGGHMTIPLMPIIEGAENKPIKCPEDCTPVKELQKKLSESLKTIQALDLKINANTQTSMSHAKSISDLNESLKEMQDNQSE